MSFQKNFLYVTLPAVLLVSAFSPAMVSAHEVSAVAPNARLMSREDVVAPKRIASAAGAARQTLQHVNADKEIDRRIAALKVVSGKITNMKRISEDQKTALLAQVQKAIDDLTTLKAKIDADTDEATLKADKQSIITSYRIYLLLIPKVELLAHADLALQLSTQMASDNTTIETKIQTQKDAGKDVTTITALFEDRKAKIADAQVQATNVITSVVGLAPEGYPENKSTLTDGRATLKTVRQDLSYAYQDLVKINVALAAMGK